jgi:phage tail-like protein
MSSGAGSPSLDPFKSSRFRVMWDGRYVAGISRVGPLRRTTEVIVQRDGGESVGHRLPGETRYEPITLERGITFDTDFEKWATMGAGPEPIQDLRNFRKDIAIELYNEAGQLVLRYLVHRCWVSEYQALPDLDAGANAVAIEHIRIENEGWERDTSVAPPVPTE